MPTPGAHFDRSSPEALQMHRSLPTSPSAHVLFAAQTIPLKGATQSSCSSLAPLDHEALDCGDTAFHPHSPGTQHRAWHRAGAQGKLVNEQEWQTASLLTRPFRQSLLDANLENTTLGCDSFN